MCVCVRAHPFACGYQQTASHTGGAQAGVNAYVLVCVCVCILAVNQLEIQDAKCERPDTLGIDCTIPTEPAPCASLGF